MKLNVDIVFEELTKQVAELSKEKAIYVALATQYKQELEQVKKELEQIQKDKEEIGEPYSTTA